MKLSIMPIYKTLGFLGCKQIGISLNQTHLPYFSLSFTTPRPSHNNGITDNTTHITYMPRVPLLQLPSPFAL